MDASVRYLCKTDALPQLPQDLKIMTDHHKPEFIKARQAQLDTYLSILTRIPYVEHVNHFKNFCGITMDKCEISIVFDNKTKIESIFEIKQNPGTDPFTSTYYGLVSKIHDKRKCIGLQQFDVVAGVNRYNHL